MAKKTQIPDWLWNNQIFESDNLKQWEGFVYKITHIPTGKFYIGKKSFWSHKTQSNGRKKTFESDWKKYCGSSPEFKAFLKLVGKSDLKREIISLHTHKGDMTFMEMVCLIKNDVLQDSNSFNGNILGKFFKERMIDIHTRMALPNAQATQ